MIKKVAILANGGDVAGFNAVIRGIVKTAENNGIECYGFIDGYNGLLRNEYEKLSTAEDGNAEGILPKGGSIIGSSTNANVFNYKVVDENGNDVNSEYNKAVSMALSKIQNEDIDLVILQSRSPTCGVNQIYDGSFTGKLISGMGFFAKALKQRGYNVIDVEEV